MEGSSVTTENNTALETQLSAEILTAYLSKNPVSAEQLPGLIKSVFDSVSNLTNGETEATQQKKKPAVPVNKSLHDDYIICLEDGKKFKSLKRHLSSHYQMSPEEYREKWGLPYDYPMVAPNYAKKRSQLARDLGLGRKPGVKIKKKAS